MTFPFRRSGARWAAAPVLAFTLAACGERPADEPAGAARAEAAEDARARPNDAFRIADVGFRTPEAVVHDPDADVYLVSNIRGDPFAKDGNGFISRVSPGGQVLELRWIDGRADGVTLHAPKGMALSGERLYVADIDEVRVFDRNTGAPIESFPVEGATFLNDVTAARDGTVYVTDSGLAPGFAPSGTDAIHSIRDGRVEIVLRSTELSLPNGIIVRGDELIVVPFGSHTIFAVPRAGGEVRVVAELPAGQLDGVVAHEDNSLLVSSWEAGAVYRVRPDGEVKLMLADLREPAAIGYDQRRNRVLVPLFNRDRIEVRTIP